MLQSGKLTDLLLLIAIHFHTSHHSAIADLVRASLGLKVPIRKLQVHLILRSSTKKG